MVISAPVASRCRALFIAAFYLVAINPSHIAQAESATAPQTSDAASDLQKSQIAWAEAWGRAVFDAYKATTKVSNLASDSALSTAANAVTDKCKGKYRAVVVAPPGMPADRIAVYYIGTVPKEQGLMIGRHYRVDVSGDGKTALSVAPSTTTCLVLPPQPSGNEKTITLIKHTLTPAPSEFHVFLSLLSRQPLFIGTKSGVWQVKDGKIQPLKTN
jgi:hypothetical protein